MLIKYIKIFFLVDLVLLIAAFFYGGFSSLINSQFAFVSSLLITLATFISYKNSVLKRIENFEDTNMQSRDLIDEIDDVHDLYSPDIEENPKELSSEEIKMIIKEEKAKVKKHYVKNTIASASSFMSFYRMGGYFLLIVGLLYLTNNNLFSPIPYLIGLFVVPLSMLLSSFILKEEEDQ